ncbi:gamma carbonic anhydrase family protein [Arabiibacter massiliensis]|uniref:gamma carbonic anhydrase family protein n=1 Tax=Arabiibacter massiliensis TaxID=1870985 RepID=UPI0009BC3C52|nr:gamma carbonic anhydrase family protein [Arabiibacter massiliensis]
MAIPVLERNCYHQVKAHPSALVSPHASIMGDVTLGRDATVLDGARLRGDDAPITIGDETNLQENVVVHADVGDPVVVGNHVTVGHRAILHGCAIGDNTLVGMGSIVMNRAVVGSNSLVAAGAIVTEDKQFPDGCLIMGVPARIARMLSEDEIALMCVEPADEYLVVRAALHEEGLLAHPEPGQRVFPER